MGGVLVGTRAVAPRVRRDSICDQKQKGGGRNHLTICDACLPPYVAFPFPLPLFYSHLTLLLPLPLPLPFPYLYFHFIFALPLHLFSHYLTLLCLALLYLTLP